MLERRLDSLETKVDSIEHKVDALSASADERSNAVDERFRGVDRRFDAIDKRFDDLTQSSNEAFVEPRQYTEFAFERLEKAMTGGFARLERKSDLLIERAR